MLTTNQAETLAIRLANEMMKEKHLGAYDIRPSDAFGVSDTHSITNQTPKEMQTVFADGHWTTWVTIITKQKDFSNNKDLSDLTSVTVEIASDGSTNAVYLGNQNTGR